MVREAPLSSSASSRRGGKRKQEGVARGCWSPTLAKGTQTRTGIPRKNGEENVKEPRSQDPYCLRYLLYRGYAL